MTPEAQQKIEGIFYWSGKAAANLIYDGLLDRELFTTLDEAKVFMLSQQVANCSSPGGRFSASFGSSIIPTTVIRIIHWIKNRISAPVPE